MPGALLLVAAAVFTARAAETIEAFGLRWVVPVRSDWKYETVEGAPTLSLLVPRPSTQPRRPIQYALADTPRYLKFTLTAEVKKEPQSLRQRRNSLIFVYAWRDKDHFNYVHLSHDSAAEAAHHNGVFHVFGGDRVRISSLEGPATLTEERWYPVRLVYDGTQGRAEMFVDGRTSPSLLGVDLSLRGGKVGLGSFFDTGQFRNVRLEGETE